MCSIHFSTLGSPDFLIPVRTGQALALGTYLKNSPSDLDTVRLILGT